MGDVPFYSALPVTCKGSALNKGLLYSNSTERGVREGDWVLGERVW